MPIKDAAKKAWKQAIKHTKVNNRAKDKIKDLVKKTQTLIGKKEKESALTKMKESIKAIDKAVQRNILKKNAGARKKSRLMKKLNALVK